MIWARERIRARAEMFGAGARERAAGGADGGARLEVAPRREKFGARKFRAEDALHLLVPVVERRFAHADQAHGAAIIGSAHKINIEELQPAFPISAGEHGASDALEIDR